VAVAVNEPEFAVIVALPTPTPVAKPPAVIVATAVEDELQLTVPVKFCLLPSLNVPVAVSCWLIPSAIEKFTGVTDKEANTGSVTVNGEEPLTVPAVAVIVAIP
jgi:hypothetical protein